MNKAKNTKKGFTLVETLVAITVLLVGIIGPIYIATEGIKAAMYAKDQVIAGYLAQDALEYMIATQKQGVFGGTAASDDQNGCITPEGAINSKNCYIDTSNITTPYMHACFRYVNGVALDRDFCPEMTYDDTKGYGYEGFDVDTATYPAGTLSSGFRRYINMERITGLGGNGIRFRVVVLWQANLFARNRPLIMTPGEFRPRERSFVLETNIYNTPR